MAKPENRTASDVMDMIDEEGIKFVDIRFTDTAGQWQHVTLPRSSFHATTFEDGKYFDGSSLKGWKDINESDLSLRPDPSTAVRDPFSQEPTLILTCDVVEPTTMQGYERDPRSVAKRAEAYLQSTGIADVAYFGPEPEFFVFDEARWSTGMNGCFYDVDAHEGAWNSGTKLEGGNTGHRPGVKGGYFPVPPVDSGQDMRSQMSLLLEEMGLKVEAHHHEVGTGGQNEIATEFGPLTQRADAVQILKYVVHNVAHIFGKTATFMPKPLLGDNGSGMHCHQSLAKDGENLFAGDKYAGLSDTALYYIGGIIKHARALNAFTNPTTNSYKRLVPGFEAPVLLAYSARNRSAAIRIPHVASAKGRRIEVRFPDPCANPYLAFSAMLLAGLDGIRNKIHPSDPMDKDLYDLPPEELKGIPTVCHSLEMSLDHLNQDREFLMQGDVFTADMLDVYCKLKMEEITRIRMAPHPLEFEMWYSL